MNMLIEPYEKVGPLRFGMSRDEIIAVMGDTRRITTGRNGSQILWYDHVNIIMNSELVAEVGLAPEAEVLICGIRPFADSDAFMRLCELDAEPYEVFGAIVLLNLGISLGGFHDGDESQKGITAFARGRWDIIKSKMKPFVPPIGRVT